MPSYEDIENQILADLDSRDFESDEATKIIRNLQTFNQLKPKPEPTPPPEPEPEPQPSWWDRHSDTLIKSGLGFLGVVVIVGGEKLGNHLYNTKAWGTIPK